ncbi:MAG: hypothetical protein IJR33_04165 [Clostridia bacterium]|nr:hypothetical protein [Clostridia bacterium]
MKKLMAALLSASMLLAAIPVMAEGEISVEVNGQSIDFAKYDNVMPYIENDYTLIPVRAIAESLGLNVDWDEETKTVSIYNFYKSIELVIDSDIATVDYETKSLDIPARITDDRTFIPLRFVSENMGATVDWEEESRLIKITAEILEDPQDPNSALPNFEFGEAEQGDKTGGNGGGHGNMGGGMTQNDPDIQAVIDANSSKFEQRTFEDEKTGITLEYSLYVPEKYNENTSYPLIMFIPDSTGAGKSAKEIVEQYYGADVWVTDEDQAKHASFVLVPAFSETVVKDDWSTSEQIETAVNLIDDIQEQYNIDADRLYTTGQSMGCMTSLYLNSKYPDMFAACMFVSGQWDISVLKGMEKTKFFYITAGGDEKASGGQDEVKAMFDADGVKYTYAEWDAQLSDEEQTANVEKLLAENLDANMVRFETGTVLNGGTGMEHMASFNYGYKLTAVRDWIFEQSK